MATFLTIIDKILGPVIAFRPIKCTAIGKEFPPVSSEDIRLLNCYVRQIMHIFHSGNLPDFALFSPSTLQEFKEKTLQAQNDVGDFLRFKNLNI